MKTSYRRMALLTGGSVTALGITMLAAAPAQAACVVTPAASPVAGTVTCATTTTTDTTYAGVSPAIDRHYLVDTSTTAFTGTVSAGAIIDDFGLAFTNTVGGTNALNVVNNGVIQVDALLTPTQGGSAALDISAIGATPVNYSGAGDIFNLGTGAGLRIDSTGTGNITAVVGGSVTSTTAEAISIAHSGTAGNISLTTTAGETISAGNGQDGIEVDILNAASAGTVTVTNAAAIRGTVAGTGTDGIDANTIASNRASNPTSRTPLRPLPRASPDRARSSQPRTASSRTTPARAQRPSITPVRSTSRPVTASTRRPPPARSA
jgi:hypothetical protein